jgi:RNA polymerase sigma factor (TIGR02999 family)
MSYRRSSVFIGGRVIEVRPLENGFYLGLPKMPNDRSLAASNLTALLNAWSLGDATALERLTPIVYSELHRLAHRQMAGERAGHVLQPSGLVNEAFLRLMGSGPVDWANRRQFYAASARLMRQVLVDFARAEETQKRGGREVQTQGFEIEELSKPQPSISLESVIAIDEALKLLETLDPRQAQVVELRFFGGLENGEIANLLDTSERTVIREWRLARAFLFQSLGSKP